MDESASMRYQIDSLRREVEDLRRRVDQTLATVENIQQMMGGQPMEVGRMPGLRASRILSATRHVSRPPLWLVGAVLATGATVAAFAFLAPSASCRVCGSVGGMMSGITRRRIS